MSCINAFRGDIHAIPSQAEQFAQTQGAGEREVDAQPQLRIITNFQSTEQRFGCPDITFLGSVLGQGSVNAGILFHEFPFYSLLKGTPQNLMNRTDCTGGNKLVLLLPTHRVSSLIFEQPLIIPLDHAGGDILQLHRADERSYVIGDQCSVCLIG